MAPAAGGEGEKGGIERGNKGSVVITYNGVEVTYPRFAIILGRDPPGAGDLLTMCV